MRTDKELIQLMIDNLYLIDTGLCKLASQLCDDLTIGMSEMIKIKLLIYDNAPLGVDKQLYYWQQGQIEPRREFLQNLLNKLQ